jgi:hypothetical protein
VGGKSWDVLTLVTVLKCFCFVSVVKSHCLYLLTWQQLGKKNPITIYSSPELHQMGNSSDAACSLNPKLSGFDS